MLYSRNTNKSGNIIKYNLRTSMNERTHSFIKIHLSLFILERVEVSVVCERWVERQYTQREDFFFPYLLLEPGGANACTPLQARLRRFFSAACPFAWLRFSALCPNLVLISWSPSGYTSVWPECPDALSSSCLQIKMWQLTKAHGVTRDELKIHVIGYITQTHAQISHISFIFRRIRKKSVNSMNIDVNNKINHSMYGIKNGQVSPLN